MLFALIISLFFNLVLTILVVVVRKRINSETTSLRLEIPVKKQLVWGDKEFGNLLNGEAKKI